MNMENYHKYDYDKYKKDMESYVDYVIKTEKEKHFDLDMDSFTHDYKMLDEMAIRSTLKEKKEFVFKYIYHELTNARRSCTRVGELSQWHPQIGKYAKYNGVAIDVARLENYVEYLFYKYKDNNGVRFKRQYVSSNSYRDIDANGRIVCKWETQFTNEKECVLEKDAVNV